VSADLVAEVFGVAWQVIDDPETGTSLVVAARRDGECPEFPATRRSSTHVSTHAGCRRRKARKLMTDAAPAMLLRNRQASTCCGDQVWRLITGDMTH